MEKEIYGQLVPKPIKRDANYYRERARAWNSDPCPWPASLRLLLNAVKENKMDKKPIPFIREKLFGYIRDEGLWRLHELREEKKFWSEEAYKILTQNVEEREKYLSQEFREKVAHENPSLLIFGVKKK
jgi:hypothetical protein